MTEGRDGSRRELNLILIFLHVFWKLGTPTPNYVL